MGKDIKAIKRNEMSRPYFTDKQIFEAFWDKVGSFTAGPDDCWEWIGGTTDGYGHFQIRGKKIYAHRYSYIIHNGDIPEGLYVLHECDNRLCINPTHLFLGTQADNIQDMQQKGRALAVDGERNPNCKLSNLAIKVIREIWEQRPDARLSISQFYEITPQYASQIARGKVRKCE